MKDYEQHAALTASGVFNPEDVGVAELRRVLAIVIDASKHMDLFKKVLFRKRSREEAGLYPLPNHAVVLGNQARDYDELIHGIVGAITEVGEMAETLDALLAGNPVDVTNVREEIGDVLWYLACQARWSGTTLDDEMVRNINKLRMRHGPAGFDKERDMQRDLAAERKTLEEEQ